MPTSTYIPLANVTLSASAVAVSITGISQAYKDLVLVINGTTISGGEWLEMRFNSDSGSNYAYVTMVGDGSTTSSATSATQTYARIGVIGGTTEQTQFLVNVMDYSATDKHKSVLARADIAAGSTRAFASRWGNTSAITTLSVASATNLAVGTTLALYGIAA